MKTFDHGGLELYNSNHFMYAVGTNSVYHKWERFTGLNFHGFRGKVLT